MLWETISQPAHSILLYSLTWLEEFQQARTVNADTVTRARGSKPTWKPEVEPRCKMNVDAAFLPQMTKGGTGGILRSAQGQFTAAFAHTI